MSAGEMLTNDAVSAARCEAARHTRRGGTHGPSVDTNCMPNRCGRRVRLRESCAFGASASREGQRNCGEDGDDASLAPHDQSLRQKPARESARPTTTFFPRRAIRFGSPDARALAVAETRAARNRLEVRVRFGMSETSCLGL